MMRYSVHPFEHDKDGTSETAKRQKSNLWDKSTAIVVCTISTAFIAAIIVAVIIFRYFEPGGCAFRSTTSNDINEKDARQTLHQDFAFASYYQSNMVLQREPHESIIWGYGTIGATVNISVNGAIYSTEVGLGNSGRGQWSVKVNPQPVGTQTDIRGVHNDGVTLQFVYIANVLFGDVFLCSGQSNMEMTLGMVYNACEELKDTLNYPDIRVFTVKSNKSSTPLYDLAYPHQSWTIPSPDTMSGPDWTYFSGLCWLYGKYLYNELKIPIGLLASSAGTTPIEAWSSPTAFETCRSSSVDHQTQNEVKSYYFERYNAMIYPLFNLTIKGIIWYQGESNTQVNPDLYPCLFPKLITDWRQRWYEGSQQCTDPEFPFGFVQIGGPMERNPRYPLIRWYQTAGYGYVPNLEMANTFMAVSMDLPDPETPHGSIHPRFKQDIAVRLVAGALHVIYNIPTVHEGPFPENVTEVDERKIIIQYPLSQELVVSDRGNFQICCQRQNCSVDDPEVDPKWHATEMVEHSNHTVTIDSRICEDNSTLADKVRYAWALSPCDFKKCSVYNKHGFPGVPFFFQVDHDTSV